MDGPAPLAARLQWTSDDDFAVDGVSFHAATTGWFASSAERFYLMKPRPMVESFLGFVGAERPRRIVELGVFRGGSTALLAVLLEDLEQLSAFEISPEPIEALAELAGGRGLDDRVHVHYGVDQRDLDRVEQAIIEDFGPVPALDLVIDDASHALDATRASFELLFPMLRPGGLYIIEDWAWGHFVFARERAEPSMARLILEIVLSQPYAEDVVTEVVVNKYLAAVRRGSRPIEGPRLELARCLSPRGIRMLRGEEA